MWVLSLLLVFAQLGAVLHELGHLSHGERRSGVVTLHLEQQPAESAVCPGCEAFAQVANPAGGACHVSAACPAGLLPVAERGYAIVGADPPVARSRGPPQV
jgi:hypothetical protein